MDGDTFDGLVNYRFATKQRGKKGNTRLQERAVPYDCQSVLLCQFRTGIEERRCGGYPILCINHITCSFLSYNPDILLGAAMIV